MVAGGGASVIYSDTICDLGGADELANYGEYSGKFKSHSSAVFDHQLINTLNVYRFD